MSEIVIIGGTSGVGRALAAHYVARGRSVAVAGRDAARARAVAADLAAGRAVDDGSDGRAGRIRGLAADLTRPDGLADALADVEKVGGLVLAGVHRDHNTIADYDVARAAELATLKIVGYTTAVHLLAPRMDATASVLLFGGLAKDHPYPGSTTVTAVNAAVVGLVRTLSIELAPIRVNSIHPGLIADSPAWADKLDMIEADSRSSLSGRLPTMADIVDGSTFLLDNRAANGVDLVLHGGRR